MKLTKRRADNEIKAAFASINEETPIYRAILQLIDDEIEEVTSQVRLPDNSENHGAIAYCAGGLAWLMELREIIEKQYEDAHPLS